MFNARIEIIGAKKIDETRQKPCTVKLTGCISVVTLTDEHRDGGDRSHTPCGGVTSPPAIESLDSAGAAPA